MDFPVVFSPYACTASRAKHVFAKTNLAAGLLIVLLASWLQPLHAETTFPQGLVFGSAVLGSTTGDPGSICPEDKPYQAGSVNLSHLPPLTPSAYSSSTFWSLQVGICMPNRPVAAKVFCPAGTDAGGNLYPAWM